MNIPADKSSTFFSLIIFINCGNEDAAVKMPATMPIIEIKFNGDLCYVEKNRFKNYL